MLSSGDTISFIKDDLLFRYVIEEPDTKSSEDGDTSCDVTETFVDELEDGQPVKSGEGEDGEGEGEDKEADSKMDVTSATSTSSKQENLSPVAEDDGDDMDESNLGQTIGKEKDDNLGERSFSDGSAQEQGIAKYPIFTH